MESWSRAVLEWVNCLDILEANINDLRELQDGKFCAKLIKILSETESQDDGDDKNLISRFIQDKYPEFFGTSKEEEGNYKEIHIVSLLLLHSSHEPRLHRPMCIKLSNETQIKIKSFLEKVLEYGSSVTRDNIDTAIMETTENFVRTPPATPKMRPLKDFFNSPATTVRKNYNKIMDERTREVRSLKAELETERFEKADLQEDLEIQRQKNLSLQQKLQEKIAEIKIMREESVRFDTPQSSKKKKDIKTPRIRLNAKLRDMTEEVTLLKSEIINLQDEKQSLMRKLASVERSCVTFKERSQMNERNLETLLIQADIKDQEIAELKNHNEELRSHIQETRRQTIAEQSFEMEMTTMSASNSSLNGSEVLSSVIDIQLQEAKEESKVFKFQVEDLNRRLESVRGDYQALQQSNQTLEAEVSQFKTTKQQLNEVRMDLDKYIEMSKTLETEKLHFKEEAKKFETLFLSKEKLLEQSEQRNKQNVEDLRDLENQLKTAHDLLNRERNNVISLETLILQKEEVLKTEYLRYENLEQKYTILRQENSGILEQVRDLENLVSLKESSLSQAQKQREALELDLRNLKDELKNVKDLLITEKARVKDLESMISQMKSEHEETVKMQLSRHQNLEEKYVNLKREKEDLNLKIKLNETLLKESLERNENLALHLQDLDGKLQTAENGLVEERRRVKDLESEVTRVETDKREFTESQFSKYQILENKYVNMERENSRLVKNIEDLNNVVSLKEQSIKQCWKERENLESTLNDLTEKFLNLQDSLGRERTRVENLESTITRIEQENEVTLQHQLESYQALEKIHTNVEEERMNLSTEVNRLNSLISSKEELLQKQNGEFEINLRKLNENLLTVQGLLNVERTKVNALESTLSDAKLQHEQTIQGETVRYKELEEKYSDLENERINLLQEIKNLNHKIAEKENLLTRAREEEENLVSKLEDLNDKLRSVQKSLAEERSRVEDLESNVIRMKQEKEEIVETQTMSYQTLQKEYMGVEKEKLDLLENTEKLNNLLSSKEELLQQLQQHNSKLEVDLCGANGELNAAATKVESLESALSQIKLEIDKIIQLNESLHTEISSLKSAKDDLYEVKEQLHKETKELNQERSRLLEQIEELKTHAASKEDLLRKTQQQNEALQSKLRDLNEEVKSVQNLLSAKSNRVKDLESKVMHIEQEKEEMLQNQLVNYQALEKKLIDVEQGRLDLLKNAENLENLLSSKEELLEQLGQHNAKLESYLCQKKDEMKTLRDELDGATTNVKSLESALAETNLETEKIIQSNESLHAEMRLLKSAKDNLYEVKERLHKQSEELEQEKSSLLQENEYLKTQATSKEEMLRQTQQQNEVLQSKLNHLDEEVKSVKNLFDMESSRIKDLESKLTYIKHEKEEMLQSHLMSYQALEKKHMDLQQEKLDLLKDIENLKNLLFSKEELLQKSQQHSAKLESNFCDAKNEMKIVQNELDTATASIKSLESALAESKLEIDKVIQSNESLRAEINLLKSAKDELYNAKEQLYKQSEELEQERSRLLGKIEELTTHVSSKEELLRQTQQRNEALQSKLKDLDDEVKSVHNLLSAKSSRIENLESTLTCVKQEKDEILQSQLMSYQALEKKHMDAEQEKLILLKDAENLKNVIVSKEETLQQSQRHSAKLEDDLCDAKDEMKSMQDEIEAVTTKVRSLESAFAETKLETQKIMQSNESLHAEISLLKSARDALDDVKQQLHKQSEELEQEKSHLQEEIEELKVHATSKEELLKQTQQQNERLQSKLRDLDEEVKSLQNLLNAKSAKVESLETILAETESERKESLSVIEKLKLENAEHKNLIQGCTSILKELVKHSSQLTGNEITDISDTTILDLSKQLKTLINSLEVIQSTKDSELKNFEATVSALDSTVSKLKTDMVNFEEMKMKDDRVISEFLKEITDLRIIAEEKDTLLKNMDKLKQQLSDERSKTDLLNEEKMLLGRNLLDVRRSLVSLKNERSVLVENVKDQNQDLLTKMASISEVIVRMREQINIDNNMILRLSEEKTLLASKYDEEKRVKTDLETKCESLENENKSHTKEKKELKDKLNVIRVRNAKLEKNLDDLRKENKKLESEKPSAEDESKVDELNASISKLQLQIQELEAQKIELSKRPTEQDFDSRIKEMHVKYEQKLENIKQKMKVTYNEQIAKVSKDQERLMQEKLNGLRVKMEEQCRKHAEEITKYKDHVTKLSSDYWDVGEKLLVEKQQKENIAQQLQDLRMSSQYQRSSTANNIMSQSTSTTRSKTSSLDRREFATTTRDETSGPRTVQTIKEEVTPCARRESIQSVQTMQGMGNAFKVEDEEGEVFNTNYLADMKAGRCSLAPDLERLSVLQMRNARCRPHLKSSYPAETQFQPETFTEEEIKSGSTIEDVFNDSLSQSLLPGEKTKKRDRTQTLYKRPGPPTPSKNGGRLSLQGNESRSPNSRILRERNVERRSTATPRRLKDLFGGSSRRQDENVSGTPKGRRLSSIFRKPK